MKTACAMLPLLAAALLLAAPAEAAKGGSKGKPESGNPKAERETGKPDDKGGKPDDKGGKPDDKGGKPDDKGGKPEGKGGKPVEDASPGKSGGGHGHDHDDDDDRPYGNVHAFGHDDDDTIRRCWGEASTAGLPPGLAKRESLPPGLQKQLERNGQLPPGLEKKLHDLPEHCERRLPRLPTGVRRVALGDDVLLLDEKTNVVRDILRGILASR